MHKNSFNSFHIDHMAMRYSVFAPRLFNFCLSLGMQANKIMPSRAFCSDENQGYPIILIAKHFGSFPFNHGRVGGIVATDRHGPHADHGKDAVIIQASHVGYDPVTQKFGVYKRLQTDDQEMSADCGAISGVLEWYKKEYDFACQQISLEIIDGTHTVVIDNQLLNQERSEGIFLNYDQLIENNNSIHSYSTAKSFVAAQSLIDRIGKEWPSQKTPIGGHLYAELFRYKRNTDNMIASGLLNNNLINAMPEIIRSRSPELSAAQVNVQKEFDRTFRTIVKEKSYAGKKVVFISGIHIDISPREGQLFPLTKFVPWAAYIQTEDGKGYTIEQEELFHLLNTQSTSNPHKIDLTSAIHEMEKEPEIELHADNQ